MLTPISAVCQPVEFFAQLSLGKLLIGPAVEIASSGERRCDPFENRKREDEGAPFLLAVGRKPSAKQTSVAIRAADRTG